MIWWMLVLSDCYEPRYKRRVQCFLHVSRGLQRNTTSLPIYDYPFTVVAGPIGQKRGEGIMWPGFDRAKELLPYYRGSCRMWSNAGKSSEPTSHLQKDKSISKQCHLVQVYSWYRQPKSLQQSRNVLIYEQLHLPNHDRVSIMDTYLSNTEQKQVT
jgi:hypothetical protein